MTWQVVDNVTGRAASKAFDAEWEANQLCRAFNLQYGPGGRYGVREVTPGACGCECHDEGEPHSARLLLAPLVSGTDW